MKWAVYYEGYIYSVMRITYRVNRSLVAVVGCFQLVADGTAGNPTGLPESTGDDSLSIGRIFIIVGILHGCCFVNK